MVPKIRVSLWLAHDDDNFYIGVQVKDDVVNSDDPMGSFWNDDATEIQVDALNTWPDTASYGTPVGAAQSIFSRFSAGMKQRANECHGLGAGRELNMEKRKMSWLWRQ
jgi:hypothetical protein